MYLRFKSFIFKNKMLDFTIQFDYKGVFFLKDVQLLRLFI